MPKQTFFNLPDEKRQTLIDLALDEFAGNDYQSASISRLVAQAGIAKGSFYQYFEDKQDLYSYLFQLGAEQKVAFLSEAAPPDPEMALFDYLSWVFQRRVLFDLYHPRFSKLTYRALSGDSPLPDDMVARAKATADDYFRRLLETGLARGDIDPAIDLDVAVFVLSAVLIEFGKYMSLHLGLDPASLDGAGLPTAEAEAMQGLFDKLLYILQHGMEKKND
jgi:AcrR family transcriptional regulator